MDNIRLTKVVDHGYEAVVVRTADYYPFGMVMPGRNKEYVEGKYRFGYNGMEMDNEVSGNGNSYTTEFRQYDPRLGRWKSLDPLMAEYPWMSPYVAFNDNPIFFVDPLGLEGEPPGGLIIEDANKGSEHADGTSIVTENTDWEQTNVFGKNTNIIKAIERTGVGGYASIELTNKNYSSYMITGYICKSSENYQKDKYYDNYTYQTSYKNILNTDSYGYPENYIYKDNVTNKFIIRDNYIYHRQMIERTKVFVNYETGKYLYTQIDKVIIEQKQYFDNSYRSISDIILDQNGFYQKKTVTLGPKKVDQIEITKEMKDLINEIIRGKTSAEFQFELREQEFQSHQDYIEQTIRSESEPRDIEPSSSPMKFGKRR